MPRDYKLYLEDIQQAIGKIYEYISGLDFEIFKKDSKTIDAVVRNLEIVGEAVKQVPENVRIMHPNIDWKKIAGLRDILIHSYFGVDIEIIWSIIQNNLPELKEQIDNILNK